MHNTDKDTKVIVIGLRKNLRLKEHATPVPAKLTVLEGSVKYIQGEATTVLNQYDEQEIPVQIVRAGDGSRPQHDAPHQPPGGRRRISRAQLDTMEAVEGLRIPCAISSLLCRLKRNENRPQWSRFR